MERDLFAWILVGLVTGVAGKFLLPGRDPGGFVVTLLLGIAGAMAAGILARALRGALITVPESIAWSAAGAVMLLLVYRVVMYARTR